MIPFLFNEPEMFGVLVGVVCPEFSLAGLPVADFSLHPHTVIPSPVCCLCPNLVF